MQRTHRRRHLSAHTFCELLEPRTLLSLTPTTPLPNVNATVGTALSPINLDSFFSDPDAAPDLSIFNTTLGTIPVVLTPGTTPLTVANFLSYVNSGAYTDTIIHRSVPGFIWQAGGFTLPAGQPPITTIPTHAPVQNEFSASNVAGTIAMAKLGNDPNSATDQFFFNLVDNSSKLDDQNGGFTVFGHILNDAGLAVMKAIAAVPVPDPGPLASPFDEIPLQNYTAGTQPTASNVLLINSITQVSELFTVTSDTPGVATASVQGNTLTLNPVAGGRANISITGYGSDGQSTTETFAVSVSTSVVTPPVNPPVVPPSVFTPTASGAFPASTIAGQPAKIQQVITLTPGSAVSQTAVVSLSLSTTTTGSANDFTLASVTTKKLKLKAHQLSKVSLSATKINAAIPAGTYHVLATVTDPSGDTTTIDTGKTLAVQAPMVDLSGSFTKVPVSVKHGKNGTVTVRILNTGNIAASGNLTLTLSTSPDQTLANGTQIVVSPHKGVKLLPNKPLTLTISFPAGAAPSSYFLIARIDPADVFSDSDLTNNTFASAAELTIV